MQRVANPSLTLIDIHQSFQQTLFNGNARVQEFELPFSKGSSKSLRKSRDPVKDLLYVAFS